MVALKKLIAFSATISLVATTSFAQTAQTPSPYYRHTKARANRRATVASRPAKNQKVASNKPLRGHRGLASVDEPVQHPPSPRYVMIGKKKYMLAERYSGKGRLLSTLVVGENYREMKVDTYGTGTATKWEVTKGLTTMRASDPFYGRFMKMEVEQRRKNGLFTARFAYQPKTKKYQLMSSQLHRYVSMNADDIVFGGVCSVSNVQNMKFFQDMLDKLKTTGSSDEEALLCHMEAATPLIFDKSCLDPNGGFKDSVESMEKALAKVVESGAPGQPATGAKYLACLDEHGLAEHSSRIQGFIFNLMMDGDSALEYATPSPLTAAQVNEIRHPDPKTCGSDPALQAALSKVTPLGNSGLPLIGCAPSQTGSDAEAKRGSFANSFLAEQIVMREPKDKIISAMPGKSMTDPVDAYASTMFHELVHSSGIGDEKLTLAIENCCAGVDEKGVLKACQKVDKTLQPIADAARLKGLLSIGYTKSTYAEVGEYVNKKLGDNGIGASSASDTVMNSFDNYVSPKIAADADARAKLTDTNGAICPTANQSAECLVVQTKFAQDQLQKYTTEWLSKQCPAAVQVAANKDKSEAKDICSDDKFVQHFSDLVTVGASTSGKTSGTQQSFDFLGNFASNADVVPAQLYANGVSEPETASGQQSINTGQSQSGAMGASVVVSPSDAAPVASSVPMTTTPSPGTATSGIATGIKAQVAGATLANTGGQNGTETGITAGAQPGTAASCGGRTDFVSCTNHASAAVDTVASAVSSVPGTLLPSAEASTGANAGADQSTDGPDIVVTARVKPKKQPKADTSSSTASASNFAAYAAPALSVGSADSSTSDPTIDTPNYASGSSGGFGSYGTTAAPTSSNVGFEDAPTATAQSGPTGGATARTAAKGAPGTGQAGPGAVGAQSAGGGSFGDDRLNRTPSSSLGSAPNTGPFAGEKNASGQVRTFRDAQAMESFLEHDYNKIAYSLDKTKMIQQLIDYKIVVRDAEKRLHGCTPNGGCQPTLKYDYCRKKSRLVHPGEC